MLRRGSACGSSFHEVVFCLSDRDLTKPSTNIHPLSCCAMLVMEALNICFACRGKLEFVVPVLSSPEHPSTRKDLLRSFSPEA